MWSSLAAEMWQWTSPARQPAPQTAARDEVEEAIAEGINVMYGWGPREILTEDGKVKGVVFRKCISVFNKLHVFEPKFMEDSTITIECENVLEAIGQSAQWGKLLEGTKVARHLNGTVKHDPVTFETGEPGIFVGGDIAHGARFAIDAIADGKKASESMHRFVHPGQSQTIARDLREFIEPFANSSSWTRTISLLNLLTTRSARCPAESPAIR